MRTNAHSMRSFEQNIAFGSTLREYRLKAHLEQEQVGKACGVTGNAISNWERDVARPDASLVPTLCNLLYIPLYDFFGMENPNPYSAEEKALVADYRYMTDPNKRQLRSIKSAAYTDKIALPRYTSYGYTEVAGAPGIDHRIDLNRLTGIKPLSWFMGRTYEGKPIPVLDLGYTKYVVQAKDTLWDIAKKLLGNGNKYKIIMTANDMTSTVIHTGDVLNIPKA